MIRQICLQRKRLIGIVLYAFLSVVFLSENAFSQGGSNYSIFGIGDIIYGGGAAYQSMGGSQTAIPSSNNINMLNPALWSLVSTTRLQAGYRFNQNVVSSSTDELWQNNGGLNGFSSLFNFDTSRQMSAVVLFQPVSTVNYFMASPIEVQKDETLIEGKNLYKGSGGLSALTIGFSSKIFDFLYLGGAFSGVFGQIKNNTNIDFTSDYTTNYTVRHTEVMEAYSYKLGIYLNPIENLGIGAFYEYISDANLDIKNEYSYPISLGTQSNPLIKKKEINSSKKTSMPQYVGFGLSYVFNKKLMIASDYLLGKFSDLYSNYANDVKFRDMQRFSFGINRLGNPNPYASLVDRFSYKIGAYYEQLYYTIKDIDMNEIALTAGLQLPLSRYAQVDLAFVFGTRGQATDGLVRENFLRFIIDISVGDTWFKRLRRSY